MMTNPDETGELAGWRAGLLAQIQDSAVNHARILHDGFPEYRTEDGRGDVMLARWRSNLADLVAERHDLTTRAAASGISEAAIFAAEDRGLAGRRWEHNPRNPPISRHGEAPARGQMIASIARDMWQLEHMAVVAVAVERSWLRQANDPATARQYLRNMDALWRRVEASAAVAGLTEAERNDLWGRDHAGWQKLTVVTVEDYDNPELLERFRAQSWAGIEWDLARSTANLAPGVSGLTPAGSGPPTPAQLLDRARAVFPDPFGSHHPDLGIDYAVDTAVTETTIAPGWGIDAIGEPLDHPRDSDPSAGAER